MDDEIEPDDCPRRRRRDEGRDDARRPRGRRADDFEATELLVPGGSPFAIISLYVGLIGLCLPFVGLVFAVPAFVCGLVALRQWKKTNTYGGVTGNIRAVLGLILSGVAILLWGSVAVMVYLNEAAR